MSLRDAQGNCIRHILQNDRAENQKRIALYEISYTLSNFSTQSLIRYSLESHAVVFFFFTSYIFWEECTTRCSTVWRTSTILSEEKRKVVETDWDFQTISLSFFLVERSIKTTGSDQKTYLATNTSRRIMIENKHVAKLLHTTRTKVTIINHTGLV